MLGSPPSTVAPPRAKPDALEPWPHAADRAFPPASRVGDVASTSCSTRTAQAQLAVPLACASVAELTTIAGFEQGTGVFVNVVPPEQAALYLNDDRPTD